MNIKEELLAQCRLFADRRLAGIEKAMNSVRSAINSETKSSAGDKYETGRAMMHLEYEKLAIQRAEAEKMKKTLDLIDPEKPYSTVAPGSLVKTSEGNYFISISVGPLSWKGTLYRVVSPASPAGRELLGKVAGDKATVMGVPHTIEAVY